MAHFNTLVDIKDFFVIYKLLIHLYKFLRLLHWSPSHSIRNINCFEKM